MNRKDKIIIEITKRLVEADRIQVEFDELSDYQKKAVEDVKEAFFLKSLPDRIEIHPEVESPRVHMNLYWKGKTMNDIRTVYFSRIRTLGLMDSLSSIGNVGGELQVNIYATE